LRIRGETVRYIEKIIGRDWGHRAVIIAAICLYLYLSITDPGAAKASAVECLKEIKKLIFPLTVAMFIGGAVKNLMSSKFLSKFFGKKAGVKGVFSSIAVGSVLPPCPFVSYPVIKGFDDGGAGFQIIIMLIEATSVSVGRIFCGLVIFEPEIVGLRLLFAFLSAVIIGFIYYLLHTRLFCSRTKHSNHPLSTPHNPYKSNGSMLEKRKEVGK